MVENQYRSDHQMNDLDELNQYLNAFASNESDKMIADNAYTNNSNYNSSHWQYNNASLQSSGQYDSDQVWSPNQQPFCRNNQQYIDSRFGMDKRYCMTPSEYSTYLAMFDCGVNKEKEKQYETTNDSNKRNSDFWNINGIYSMDPDFELLDMDNNNAILSPPMASSTQSSQSSTHTITSFCSTDDDQFVPNLVDLLSNDSDKSPNNQFVAKSCVESTDSTQTATIKIDDSEDTSKELISEILQNIVATETCNDNSLQDTPYDPISKVSVVTISDTKNGLPIINDTIGIKQRTIQTTNKKIAFNLLYRTLRRKSNGTAESIEVKRQRNREAAAKCRKKKLAKIDDLEKQMKRLVVEIAPFEQKVIEMRQKVYEMKKWVFRHQFDGCKV